MKLFCNPQWSDSRECLLHPIVAMLTLPLFILVGLALSCYVWGWNVIHSSSLHGSWRPLGPWDAMPNED